MATEVKKEIELEVAHVLFIDIVGYSKRLMNEQRAVIETLNEIIRNTDEFRSAEAAGRLTKIPTGDGMALVFYTSPETPVECALEIARADISHPELELRMGIHSGPVSGVLDVNERANVAGAGINMAQRVMDCGDGGHILLSKRVAEDLEQFAHWRPYLHDLGECEVKHGVRIHIVNLYTEELGNPELPKKFKSLKKHNARVRWTAVTAVLLGLATIVAGIAVFSHYRGRSAPAAPEKSIAVLPFENRSEDKDNAYFAEGIQDEILTRLSKISDLKVISRTSTQHYKSTPEDLPEVARQLGVAHILEGSVQKKGDSARVNAKLIKAADDSNLWADTLDRKLTDIFSVESEVAKTIADQLQVHLTGQEEQVITAKPTDNLEAYDSYLHGLAYTLQPVETTAKSLGAQKYLREAVRLDPKFALAWALLSFVDSSGYVTGAMERTDTLRAEARQAAETALTLQPNLGEALHAKGFYHYALKEYEPAIKYFEQARQFLPNSSRIPRSLAYVTRRQGKWDQSESYFNEAERLDPRDANLFTQHAVSLICLRRFSEALHKFDQILAMTPNDPDVLTQKAGIAQAEGDLPRAAALLGSLHFAADNPQSLETQVYQAILERRPAEMISRLKEMLAKPDPTLGYYVGELRFWLGWAQEVGGDHAAAQASWQQARSELEKFLKDQPSNYSLIAILALTDGCLGDKTAALARAEQAMAINPKEKDALTGGGLIEILARVAVQTGEVDRAIAALQQAVSIPYLSPFASSAPLTPALLRLDPMFDPLRNDPRFQKLAASPGPR